MGSIRDNAEQYTLAREDFCSEPASQMRVSALEGSHAESDGAQAIASEVSRCMGSRLLPSALHAIINKLIGNACCYQQHASIAAVALVISATLRLLIGCHPPFQHVRMWKGL
jgi:hypothetical protein